MKEIYDEVADSFETAYNSLREDFLKAYPDFAGFKEDQRY